MHLNEINKLNVFVQKMRRKVKCFKKYKNPCKAELTLIHRYFPPLIICFK